VERPDHYERLTEGLLAPWADEPLQRSRRICGIYAAIWLEDPLLHAWFGLAFFVARQVTLALRDRSLVTAPYDRFFAEGNAAIFRYIVPDWLRWRDGVPITSTLSAPFTRLSRARAATAWDEIPALAREALLLMARAEQTEVVQPHFDARFSGVGLRRHLLARGFHVRLDSGAPILPFDGKDPAVLDQRIGWMERKILPAWWAAVEERGEKMRREADASRRDAGVRLSDLPVPTWGGRPARPGAFAVETPLVFEPPGEWATSSPPSSSPSA
jgi:hypothetical protein